MLDAAVHRAKSGQVRWQARGPGLSDTEGVTSAVAAGLFFAWSAVGRLRVGPDEEPAVFRRQASASTFVSRASSLVCSSRSACCSPSTTERSVRSLTPVRAAVPLVLSLSSTALPASS